ncbi:MAG: exo-beta-N-acetylmuramidase NamZ domain-containing protein [Acidobacteriota bacterium]
MIKKSVAGNRAIVFTFAFLLFTFYIANGQGLPVARPESVGMSWAKLNQIETLVNKDIADKKLPGAVVIVGRKGKIVYRKAFGNRSLVPTVEKMTIDTIFDVASLTKVVATSTSVMVLLDTGQLRLNDTVGKFIPEIEDKDAKSITVQQLLTHVSGYQPDFDLREKWLGRGGMLNALYKEKLRNPPGTRFVYSDIGFIVLAEIVQRVTKKDVALFADENVFAPLGLETTGFGRVENSANVENSGDGANIVPLFRIAPTENVKGQQNYLGSKFDGTETQGNRILRGQVHDPTAFRMNGVAGHAGLFSTADDLARYCQMILNAGILDGTRILSPATIALMTKPNVVSETGDTRGLGFDMNTSFSQNRGEFFPLGSVGHTGFTGTGIWIDSSSETFYVFLSNRVHPDGKGDVTPLRAKVASIVASSINDLTPSKIRETEVNYFASVMPQIEKFKSQIRTVQTTIRNPQSAIVLNGIDVLEKNNFKELNGLRIGLVTNHTGRNRLGKQTIDILKEAKNVQLISLFSPEHGIRGQLDQEKIVDSIDEKTGLPIYSLYGETRRPKPEQLQNLDVLIFDIQDIGTRFYTYISTLRNVMEEAAKAKIKVIVLDRPNPINGIDVEGGLADEDKLNFIAAHTIPVRHGMTVGEMAQLMNAERKIGADLSVIKLENWTRQMWFDETNQTWVNPSPNMRSLTQATLYPGIGLMEFTNLSVGRGTDTPFEVVGAPWLDGQKLALYLNQKNIPGVRFVPTRYKPNASVFKDQECGGINIVITEREKFKPVRVGLEIASALRILFPNDWKVDNYSRLWLNAQVFEMFKQGKSIDEIERGWNEKLNAFKTRRASYLLYK